MGLMNRLLYLVEPALVGALLGFTAFGTVFLALDTYTYTYTWTWQLRGLMLGALAGVGGELLLRRGLPLQPRFTLRTLFYAMTLVAGVLGVLFARH
jgi:hypothetical protein